MRFIKIFNYINITNSIKSNLIKDEIKLNRV